MFEIFLKISNKLRSIIWNVLFRWDFYSFGRKSTILRPMRIQGAKWIAVGSNVTILNSVWLLALKPEKKRCVEAPILSIGDGTSIGNFAHIVSIESVKIGSKVLIADKVYISDNLHSFDDINIAIIDQPVKFRSAVEIGDASWIGENVCIIGARIGRHCVVAANAVVTHDVPDYCVVAGAPARIIKRYDVAAKAWIVVKN